MNFHGSEFELSTPRGDTTVKLPIPGEYNVYNAVAAIAVGISAGASLEVCTKAIGKFYGVPGRLQSVPNDKGLHIFVDYAHTDQALESVLKGIKEIGEHSNQSFNLITVFGCGGDRDPGKRPLMMKAARKYSDIVFLTSDNPRFESPQNIMDDALEVVSDDEIDNNIFAAIAQCATNSQSPYSTET